MVRQELNKKMYWRIAMAVLLCVLFFSRVFSDYTNETLDGTYEGVGNASPIIFNISYFDVINSDTWAKEAIFHSGAVDVMKGYGDKHFGRLDPLTKEQAIAVAYRIIGREKDAQIAAETLDLAKPEAEREKRAWRMWSDGYLLLAVEDGLITPDDLDDAFLPDQTALQPGDFNKMAPAERQEIAVWMAKLLKLDPVYGQQETFNNYNDWKLADPHSVPYIEAIINNNIMNGYDGYFSPTDYITREQMAQINKNAQDEMYTVLKYEKKTGTVDNIVESELKTVGVDYKRVKYYVRNTDGKLHLINVEYPVSMLNPQKNEEYDGSPIMPYEKELVVYKDGTIGNSSVIDIGDRLEYVVTSKDKVKYVNVISNRMDIKYIVAQVTSRDDKNSQISVNQFFKIDYPDLKLISSNFTFQMNDEPEKKTYVYSNNLMPELDGNSIDIEKVNEGTNLILTVRNEIVIGMNLTGFGLYENGRNIVKGVVEDNNPQLGYITLFNEDGTGSGSLRTFNYINDGNMEVLKNGKPSNMEDIQHGDSAFVRLFNGKPIAVSGVDNYTVRYGKVLNKNLSSIIVEYDDKTVQLLDINSDVLVILDDKIVGYDEIKPGDRIKMMMNIDNSGVSVEEISIEGEEHYITNVYKGEASYIDEMSKKIIMYNLEALNGGEWERIDDKGFNDIRLAEDYDIFANGKEIDIEEANKLFREKEAYIAVEKDYGGEERAVFITYKNDLDAELLYTDSIASFASQDEIVLNREYNSIKLDPGSIVIKDGRLVSGSNISMDDNVYIVANRDYESGEYVADVIKVEDINAQTELEIYRVRIKAIEEDKRFTVHSFSLLEGYEWTFYNSEKTFDLGFDTTIIGDEGVVNSREFLGYGDNSYIGEFVYVVSKDGVKADLISTAPYVAQNMRGEILEFSGKQSETEAETGGETEETEETSVSGNTKFTLKDLKIYDSDEGMWDDRNVTEFTLKNNTIIIGQNKILSPSELKEGDKIRIMKLEDETDNDVYIIFVEG